MKKSILAGLFTLVLMLTGGLFSPVRAQEAVDPAIVEVVQKFMDALNIADFEASIKAAKPYMDKTLLNADGSDITADLRRFGFKKAHENAGGYANPVKITRVRKTATTQIGFGETAGKAVVYDYFVGKKEGAGGMPAPLKVSIREGGKPMIFYIGSL